MVREPGCVRVKDIQQQLVERHDVGHDAAAAFTLVWPLRIVPTHALVLRAAMREAVRGPRD
jgi:hypothetical protein